MAMRKHRFLISVVLASIGASSKALADVETAYAIQGRVSAEVAALGRVNFGWDGGEAEISGTLTLSTIPKGARIEKAYLYVNGWNDGPHPKASAKIGAKQLAKIAPTAVDGPGAIYRWDVTSEITGNATYEVSSRGFLITCGMALGVVFSHDSLPDGEILVKDGVAVLAKNGGPDSWSNTLAGLPAGPAEITIYTSADDKFLDLSSGEEVLLNGKKIGGPLDANLGEGGSLLILPVDTKRGDNELKITTVQDLFAVHLVILARGRSLFRGEVVLGSDALPMKGVDVELIQIPNNGKPRKIGTTKTTEGGRFHFDVPQGQNKYRYRASLAYNEPATNDRVTIANYLGWDPQATFDATRSRVARIVFPEPAILQGGMWGDLGTWKALRKQFESDPASRTRAVQTLESTYPAFLCFPMPNSTENAAGFDNSADKLEHHEENANKLNAWMDDKVVPVLKTWLSATDAARVRYSFVTHSMGGVITRALLVSGKVKPHFVRVVSLDAPHGGTTWAFNVAKDKPAFMEWRMNGTRSKDDPPKFVKGWNYAFRDINMGRKWMLWALTEKDDGMMGVNIVQPDASAHGQGRIMTAEDHKRATRNPRVVEQFVAADPADVLTRDWDHSEGHDKIGFIRGTAQFLIKGTSPGGAALTGPSGNPDDEETASGMLSGVLTAAAGSSASTSVVFDHNDVVIAHVIASDAGLQHEFRDAQGQVVSRTLVGEQLFADGHGYQRYELQSPPQGAITVELRAGATAAAELEFAFAFGNGRELLGAIDPLPANPGQPVVVRGWLADGAGVVLTGTGGEFTARVTLPDGATEDVSLFDDGVHGDGASGDGVFAREFADTSLEGAYLVALRGALTVASEGVARSTVTGIVVRPASAVLLGSISESTVDADHDGYAEFLQIQCPVSFTRNGRFRLSGELRDGSDHRVSFASVDHENAAGSLVTFLTLQFPGADLASSGANGPYTLHDLSIYDLGTGALEASSLADQLTEPYVASEFESAERPTITWLIPEEGPLAGGNELVIAGSGLRDVVEVLIGDQPATVLAKDGQSVVVTVPAGTQVGDVDVVVVTRTEQVFAAAAYGYRSR